MESIEIKLRQAVDAFNKGNYQIFFDIFKPLAEEGNAKAQFHLGFLYRMDRRLIKIMIKPITGICFLRIKDMQKHNTK